MLTVEVLENRFKSNMMNLAKRVTSHIEDAMALGLLEPNQCLVVNAALPLIEKFLDDKTGSEMIYNFITKSKSEKDTDPDYFKIKKFPDYWSLLSKLPTLDEYKKEKEFQNEYDKEIDSAKNIEDVKERETNLHTIHSKYSKILKPLSPEVEHFFLHEIEIVFDITKPIAPYLRQLYNYTFPDGSPYLTLFDKKYIAVICRSFAILAIKYINLKRNPKIENGKVVTNKETGRILYHQSTEKPFFPEISVRNSMQEFGIKNEELL